MKWVYRIRITLIWFYSVHFVNFGLIQSILVLFGSLWFYSVEFGPIRSTLVLFIHSVSTCFIRSTLVPFGPFCQLCSYLVHFGPIEQNENI